MKNLFKIFFVNIIVLFFLLFVIEFICTFLKFRHIKIFKPDINFRNYIFSLKKYSKQYLQIDGHPNAQAWEVIVPALAKELNL